MTPSFTEEAITEEKFRKSHQYQPNEDANTIWSHIKVDCKKSCKNLLPIVSWLPKYNFRHHLIHDIIAGITIGIIQIPQGLTNSLLADVPAIVGIYMSVFPVIIYVLLGTSRHVSVGGFAVVSIMVGNLVSLYSHTYSPLQIATAASFMVGCWQIMFGILKLGALSVLFSETLVSGFTSAVAVHIITSQVKSLLGMHIKSFYGPFKVIFTYYELLMNITSVHWITLIISLSFLIVLVTYYELIRPRLQKKLKFPFPIEIITIIIGILISYFLNLKDFGVSVIGDVPTGFPTPEVPPLDLLPHILVETLACAIVAIAVNISLCKTYAIQFNYKIDENQDLLAHGCANLFGSFFSSLPIASSLSRSAIQLAAGGVSQLTSAVSCFLLIFVILYVGPLFGPLPHCILACIIVTAMKGMLMQIKQFPKIYHLSKIDGLIWLSTFIGVIVIDLDYGLTVGMLVLLLTMLIPNQIPKIINIGQVPGTNTYLDLDSFQSAIQIPDVLILQIVGSLNFANCDYVRERILKILTDQKLDIKQIVILDLVSTSYIDPAGVKCLISIFNNLKQTNCQLLLCQCRVEVYNTLQHCKLFDSFPSQQVFPTLQDAVALSNQQKQKIIVS